MRLILALKAFLKALKDPAKAALFLEGPAEKKKETGQTDQSYQSHLQLLAILQRSGRLIDFFKEDLSAISDEQVGAVARKIHEDCGKSLEELVTLRPVMAENEGTIVRVPQGYDPLNIKIIGRVKGEPPFSGTLLHKGWKAHKRSLPKQIAGQSSEVICPAEVEING